MTRMKLFTPVMYIGMNTDVDLGDPFSRAAFELFCDLVDEKWEANIKLYRALTLTFPRRACKQVDDFYKEVGSLHDAGYKITEKTDHAWQLRFHTEDDKNIDLRIEFDQVFKEQTFPKRMRSRVKVFLYDEFQYENGILSYHFFGTDGVEYSFYNVKISWK